MTRSELVIFDCDGVLVDSEIISNELLARALSQEGLPTTLAQAQADYQGLLFADVAASAEAFHRELSPIPGAADAVRQISGAGASVCAASQGKLKKTQLSLGLTGYESTSPATHSSPPTRCREERRTQTSSSTRPPSWRPSHHTASS